MPLADLKAARAAPYRILVCRSWKRPRARLYAFGLRSPIPDVPIPLREGEAEPVIALNALLHNLYDKARYHLRIDYEKPPVPSLNDNDAAWTLEIRSRRPGQDDST